MSRAVAILLCAGYGTRMGDLTRTTPKPLLPVADRPVLDYLVDQLVDLPELDAVHVVSNHHYSGAFVAWAAARREDLAERGLDLEVHNDGTLSNADRLGAIGDLGFVLDRLSESGTAPQRALVCAGDNILRFSLATLWNRFLSERTSQVLAMEEKDPTRLRRTGVLELDGDQVVALWEKPAEPPSCWACPSFYALGPDALSEVGPYLRSGKPADEIGRFIAHLCATQDVQATKTRGSRLHVGNPQELERADTLLRREPVLQDALNQRALKQEDALKPVGS